MRACFRFNASADAAQATLSIYDEIGFWGVQAKDFIKELQGVSAKVLNVEINSPGGDVFAGLAIYNALKSSGKEIVVKVMGVAASAASLIAMAGDKITMPKNTFMMVHNPWSVAVGNADDMRESADVLDKIGGALQATYVARTGQSEEKIKSLLATDTWLTADEALALGFATEVTDDVKAKAHFDMARADLPERVKAVFKASTETDPKDPPAEEIPAEDEPKVEGPVATAIMEAAKAEGLSDVAVHMAVTYDTLPQAQARFKDAKEIVALCNMVDKPMNAKGFIMAGKSVTDVRKELVKAMAEESDKAPINTVRNQGTAGGSSGPADVSTTGLWAQHRKVSTPARGNTK